MKKTIKHFKHLQFKPLAIPFILLSLLLVTILSCSEFSSYESRLKSFYELLDPTTLSAFEKGDIQAVSDYLERKQSDPDFMEKYQSLKEKEAINRFNHPQTVEFFYKYFYLKKN